MIRKKKKQGRGYKVSGRGRHLDAGDREVLSKKVDSET